jgi:hypothetical protein
MPTQKDGYEVLSQSVQAEDDELQEEVIRCHYNLKTLCLPLSFACAINSAEEVRCGVAILLNVTLLFVGRLY